MKDDTQGKPLGSTRRRSKSPDRFLERMLSGMSHPNVPLPRPRPISEAAYQPLHELRLTPGARYHLPDPAPGAEVRADSPALAVMTDLTKVTPITTRSLATIDEANRTMMSRAVRALFVVDDSRVILGIVTSTDILGEKPIQFAQQRGIRHDEVVVRDLMTPAERLEAMELDDVLHARVGDVVATLRLSRRQHALVVERGLAGAVRQTVRGIFSLTQIARQLGLPPQPMHDIDRTFVEIMAAITR
jgi:CBS domain-containing protein